MTRFVVSVSPDTPVAEIAEQLAERGISTVPVIDRTGKLVGIVGRSDLMRCGHSAAACSRFGRLWLTGLIRSYTAEKHVLQAKDVMTRDVVVVDEAAPIEEIEALLSRRCIKRLPVMRDGKVVGMVSRANLLFGLPAFQGSCGVDANAGPPSCKGRPITCPRRPRRRNS